MKRNSLNSRQQILKAAEEVFAREGFDKASIRAIARRARLNSALIYYYFKDKGGLYHTLLEESFRELGERLRTALAQETDPVKQLSAFIELYIRYLMEKRELAKIMHRELGRDDTIIKTLTQKYIAKNFAMLSRALEAGGGSGDLRPMDVPLTAITLVGMMAFYFVAFPITSRLLEMEDYDDAFAQRLIAHTKKLFFIGALSPGKPKVKTS
jgi:AcrR family transcriptional regulator